MNRFPGILATIAATTMLGACGEPAQVGYQGYVEGDFLYLAAPQAGYLGTLAAERGSPRSAWTDALRDRRRSRCRSARGGPLAGRGGAAGVDNLKAPRRTSEIAALQAELRAAQASLALANAALARQQALAGQLRRRQCARRSPAARKGRGRPGEAARQRIASYRDSLGREPEVLGAEAEVRAADALVAQKRWAVGARRSARRLPAK